MYPLLAGQSGSFGAWVVSNDQMSVGALRVLGRHQYVKCIRIRLFVHCCLMERAMPASSRDFPSCASKLQAAWGCSNEPQVWDGKVSLFLNPMSISSGWNMFEFLGTFDNLEI